MPRKKGVLRSELRPARADLAGRLADELRSDRVSGQPLIDEQEFPSGKVRVTVIWDDWDRLPLEERTAVILRAYELAEGRGYGDRIALASGLTVPEAYGAGMLPFQIIPALPEGRSRNRGAVPPRAMIEEGASTLLAADKPQLRFASEDEAEAARRRLVQRLPDSDPVWVCVTQEVGKVEDWVLT